MALSPQYSWPEPDNSSLVKNGAQDIRALGDAIDTSLWNVGYGQAGKNKILNGDFNIWQRGTSTSVAANTTAFVSDRWRLNVDNASGGSAVVSRQAFTPGTAPVAGYEGIYFLRVANTAGSTASRYFWQTIEDVQTFAGAPVTLSFWAKASSATSIDVKYQQNFGSGGSSAVNGTFNTGTALTTSWQRFSYSLTMPSISGKTVGTSSYIYVLFEWLNTVSTTIDIWGAQLEYGSKATPFQTASGTLQGELSLCQRYYWRQSPGNSGVISTFGTAKSTTAAVFSITCPTTMRKGPDTLDYSNIVIYDGITGQVVSALTLGATFASTGTIISFDATSTSLTQYRPYFLYTNNANGFFGVSAEL
jgi:hypothetical protein